MQCPAEQPQPPCVEVLHAAFHAADEVAGDCGACRQLSLAQVVDGREDLVAWGRWIRLLRTARGLSQQELGLLAGIDKNTIGIIERGEKNVGVLYVWRLSRALGIRTQDLFPDEGPSPLRPSSGGK